ncbi:MAG: efflux RND transporter permease subunit [Planctomycetota bacterium]
MIAAIARFAVRNPVAVNLATITVVLAGVATYFGMPREVFPDFSLGTVTVSTLYPGAAPEDVERLVTLPIEEKVEGIDGVKEMTSRSQEGLSTITLTVHKGEDMSRFVDDVRAAILSGDLELPEEAEDPIVDELKSEWLVIGVFLYGYASEAELRELAQRHKRELEKIDGVSQVRIQGALEPRIWVEVDPRALERHGLALEDVGLAVGARARSSPLGTLTTGSGDYLLRVDAEVEWADDLRRLPILRNASGQEVVLSDVARVVDTYERPVVLSRFNGEASIFLQVNKQSGGDAIDISKEVWAYIEREQDRMPPGVAIGANSDLSVYIKNRLRVMRDSATIGGILLLCALVAFLSVRVAGMTALGIPVSFLGGILIAGMLGISMNMMTMFALIIVLGMIVDDAIVVGENVFRLMEEGLSPEDAAVQGTVEVGKPVIATILTTIAAFMPLVLIGGQMGEFMRPIPVIVSLCLIASLLEALIVLPSHLAHWTGRQRASADEPARHWYDPLRDLYERALRLAFAFRWVTIVAVLFTAAFLVTYAQQRIPFVLFDDFESKVFSISLRARTGTPFAETERLTAAIEREVIGALREGELESTNMLAGVNYADAVRSTIGQNLGQVWVELRENEGERRPTSEIIETLRERFRVPPTGIEAIEILQPQAGPTGRAIDIAIRGPDVAVLAGLADELKGRLTEFAGVRDIRDNNEPGKREVQVKLTETGRLLGFDETRIGRELRAAFEGVRYGRVRRGKDEVEIMVKLPEELRLRRGALEALRVTVPGARDRVPIGLVAEIREADSVAVITRDGGERSVRVTADVNKTEGNTAAITAVINEEFGDVGDRFPGYSVEFKGEAEESAESMEGLVSALILAVLLIYMILGTLFSSFGQPLVIMFAIPFGLIGMVVGHTAMDRPLSFLSLIGLVALSGIVVNDSLILVEFINQELARGRSLVEAIVSGGRNRFRPILLTSITTMMGLSPLAFFASGQARFLQPMAITIFFGLACSTFLILIVIPCAYGALRDTWSLVRHPWRTLGRMWRNEPVHRLGSDTQPEPTR